MAATRFLTTVARSVHHALFRGADVLKQVCCQTSLCCSFPPPAVSLPTNTSNGCPTRGKRSPAQALAGLLGFLIWCARPCHIMQLGHPHTGDLIATTWLHATWSAQPHMPVPQGSKGSQLAV